MSMRAVKCCICDSIKVTLVCTVKDSLTKSNKDFNLVKCTGCGLIFVSPQPKDVSKFYPEEKYGFYKASPPKKRQTTPSLIRSINHAFIKLIFGKNVWLMQGKGKKILDIGCATGDYLLEMKELDWKVKGIEPSKEAVRIGRKMGLEIINSNLKCAKIKEKFDLITMRHVIEHLEDPVYELRKVLNLLEKEGTLMIATPNVDSWEFRIFKTNWGAFEVPRHLFLFDKKTISKALKKAGFKVVDIKKEIYPASALEGIKKMYPKLKPIVNSKTFFWIFSVFYSIIARLFGNGRMIIIAKKKAYV